MAEIDLQRKRGRNWWPWVLGLLAVLLVIWGIAELVDVEDEPLAVGPDTVDTRPATAVAPPPEYATPEDARAAMPASVAEYRQSCTEAGQEPTDMGMQHEFTINCMQLMANSFDAALQSDTVGNVALDQRLESFRSNADELRESDPSALTHAGVVSRTMESAADLVSTLREERYSDHQEIDRAARTARDAADSMSENQPMLDQQDTVQEFFRAMGTALEAIATNAGQNREVSAPASP